MIDWSNLGNDIGLYLHYKSLCLYNLASEGTLDVSANEDFHVVFTRNADGLAAGYLNGELQWAFDDTSRLVVGTLLNFFEDDTVTGKREAKSGSVDFIRLYDGVLSASEAGILARGGSIGGGNPVPEPATMMLLGIGLLGLAGISRRKK